MQKRRLPEGFPWSRKAMRPVREKGFLGRPCLQSPPGQDPHCQHPLPAASAHTPCQCVRTYAWSPPWEPAASLCQPPLMLPMWLRASETLRREGGGAAGARPPRPPLLTARLQPAHQGHFPCGDWPLGVEKLGGQLSATNDTLQAPGECLVPHHSEWPRGPPPLARTRKEWASQASQRRPGGSEPGLSQKINSAHSHPHPAPVSGQHGQQALVRQA